MVSDDWATYSTGQKISDYLWHMVLPITASVVGNFAVMTLLTKNVFLEEIRRQYVYTARMPQRPERAPHHVETRVSQCDDTADYRLSVVFGGFFHRQPVD